MGVAITISDTRGLWHADMVRSAVARLRGAKSATGLVLTRWKPLNASGDNLSKRRKNE